MTSLKEGQKFRLQYQRFAFSTASFKKQTPMNSTASRKQILPITRGSLGADPSLVGPPDEGAPDTLTSNSGGPEQGTNSHVHRPALRKP